MSNYLTGLAQLNPQVKRHNGGTTTLTLDQNGTTNATMLYVNGVGQTPGIDFNVSGATLTTTSTLPAGTNIATTIQYFNTGVVNTVADDAIGLGQMASGTDGNLITYDASGNPAHVATGSDGQVLTSAGAGAAPVFEALPSSGWTQGTETATTSGTSFNITGIPSGTQQIIINFEGLSVDDTNIKLLQIGDSGGIETSGYVGEIVRFNATALAHLTQTTSFAMYSSTASNTSGGHMLLTLKDAANFTWVESHVMSFTDNQTGIGASVKSLSSELTQFTLSSSGTFDAGSFNYMYQ